MEYDSIAATSLSTLTRAPILLVKPNKIPGMAVDVLKKKRYPELYDKIYILGGLDAISEDIEQELKTYAQEVVRLGGATRYETSVEISNEIVALGGKKLPIVTSGKDPVLYTTTLANKYLSPIIYLDRPPVRKSTFKAHGSVEGSLAIESFRSFQTIRSNSPKYRMEIDIETNEILDAWMYIHTIGFDSIAEKWTVKFNDYSLAYRIHSEPVAIGEDSQLTRFDVGKYIESSQNTLLIEGTDFNIKDQYYIADVTFVIIYDSGEKTEYWINEGADTSFEGGNFDIVKNGSLWNIYLKDQESLIKFNNNSIQSKVILPTMLQESPQISTIEFADVTPLVNTHNSFSGSDPALSILTVTSDDISVPQDKVLIDKDPHQIYVKTYLDNGKFDSFGMLYYRDSVSSG
jgi:hypothetical protein